MDTMKFEKNKIGSCNSTKLVLCPLVFTPGYPSYIELPQRITIHHLIFVWLCFKNKKTKK